MGGRRQEESALQCLPGVKCSLAMGQVPRMAERLAPCHRARKWQRWDQTPLSQSLASVRGSSAPHSFLPVVLGGHSWPCVRTSQNPGGESSRADLDRPGCGGQAPTPFFPRWSPDTAQGQLMATLHSFRPWASSSWRPPQPGLRLTHACRRGEV